MVKVKTVDLQLVLCLMVANISEVVFEGTDTRSSVTKFIVPRVTSLVTALLRSAYLPSPASKHHCLFCFNFEEGTGTSAPSVCLLLDFYELY